MPIADFKRGDTKTYKFLFTKNNAPLDITGWDVWCTFKTDPETQPDNEAVLQVQATAGGHIADDPVNGVMYLTLTSIDTAIDVGQYFYDFQRVIPGSPPNVVTLDSGQVTIEQDVTLSDA